MRLVTFMPADGSPRVGALLGAALVDLAIAAPLVFEESEGLHWDMLSLLRADQDEVSLETAAMIVDALASVVGDGEQVAADVLASGMVIGGNAMLLPLSQVRLLAPLPVPASLREFEAFEAHALTVRRALGDELPSAWFRAPAFSFANHQAVVGPDTVIHLPPVNEPDMGIGVACVIGRSALMLELDEAAEVIAGYMLVNHWCARDAASRLYPLGLGTAAARFATSLGPALVTTAELEIYTDDDGRLNLELLISLNGVQRSRTNLARATYSFPEIVAAASHTAMLMPGDVITTGVCDQASLLMLNGAYGPWLEDGDIVEVSATGLGMLRMGVERV